MLMHISVELKDNTLAVVTVTVAELEFFWTDLDLCFGELRVFPPLVGKRPQNGSRIVFCAAIIMACQSRATAAALPRTRKYHGVFRILRFEFYPNYWFWWHHPLDTPVFYWVRPPFASRTALNLHGIESTQCWTHFSETLGYDSITQHHCRFVTYHQTTSQKCLIWAE